MGSSAAHTSDASAPSASPGSASATSVVESKPAERRTAKKKSVKDPRDTPAMRQYMRFKKQHPDCVLFFRMGDFYEMFDEDAVEVARVLGLTLTQRTAGIPMAGVPYHAAEGYLARLIALGYRVAVCDQVQDAKDAKGVVDRDVTRVVTPGTLVDETLLDEAQANLIAAVMFTDCGDESGAVIAAAELSTGGFTLREASAADLVDEIARLGPSELLYAELADGSTPPRIDRIKAATGTSLTPRPAWTFRMSDARDLLLDQFGVHTLSGFGLEDDDPALAPAGALLRFLLETQVHETTSGVSSRLGHLQPPRRDGPDAYVTLDATSLRALEIERTMRSGEVTGSLLSVLQRARSPMGKRLLREWLCYPLRDRDHLEARQRSVAALLADDRFARDLGDVVGSVQDVARIVGRLAMGRATPRDLVGLGDSAVRITELADLLEQRPAFETVRQRLVEQMETLLPMAARITEQCVDAPPAHMRDGGLFRDGVDRELDEARGLQRDAKTWLAAYQKRLIEQTGIPSLKVGYNKVFGYYIEITNAHRDKAPAAFTRKQTLKNAERYITPELKTFEDKVTTAEARAIEREQQLFDRLCSEAGVSGPQLSAYAATVAELDVFGSFADVARRYDFVRPTLVDEPTLDIRQGRHPVLDRALGEQFVPNDCVMERDKRLALITGPNMAGKSTFIRQVALIVLLAHTGSYVPAESATIGMTDRIFTRIGASDELHAGHSTFMVEMIETANILHHATDRSLVILDELGRGTSTLDGLSLAWAIAESVAGIGCRTLFATHYHELTTLAEQHAAVCNLHVAVREWGDEIVFVYRILPGSTDRSYGIHVARIAGMPDEVVSRASELMSSMTVHTEQRGPIAQTDPEVAEEPNLFTSARTHPVVDRLREVELEALSPMAAFDLLRTLQAEASHDA